MKRRNKQILGVLGIGLFLLGAANGWAVTDEEFINYSIEFQNAILVNAEDEAKLKAAHAEIAKKYKTDSKKWKAYEAALLKDKPRFDRVMKIVQDKAAENMFKHLEEQMPAEE